MRCAHVCLRLFRSSHAAQHVANAFDAGRGKLRASKAIFSKPAWQFRPPLITGGTKNALLRPAFSPNQASRPTIYKNRGMSRTNGLLILDVRLLLVFQPREAADGKGRISLISWPIRHGGEWKDAILRVDKGSDGWSSAHRGYKW